MKSLKNNSKKDVRRFFNYATVPAPGRDWQDYKILKISILISYSSANSKCSYVCAPRHPA